MSKTSKNVNRRFYLGTVDGGSTFIFSDLGAFKTAEAAHAKAISATRNGRVYIFESWDVKHIATGVIWGSTGYKYIASVQEAGPLDEVR